MSRKELRVRKIKNGTVIDHISPGYALKVIKILEIDEKSNDIVSIAMNVPSSDGEKKDIVKVEDRELESNEVDKIALIAPNATINIIEDYEVKEKYDVELPRKVKDVIKCSNNNCISNTREPVAYQFEIKQKSPVRLKCIYCKNIMEGDLSDYLL
ncbi:aspartate carbamoyltransferase regulatory subunit [archaeon SCG-AAA382B04]|nr:aspartate carbamoyltransferase regulatory subunit [archaeon SCG-AAA382B04]